MDNIQYYISRDNGPQEGPFTASQIGLFVSTGRLAKSDLIWREGLTNWQACNTLPEISSLYREAVAAAIPSSPVGPAMISSSTVDAGFWYRVLAYLIDTLVIGIVMMPLGCLFQLGIFMAGPNGLADFTNPKPFDPGDPFGVLKFTPAQWAIWSISILVQMIAKWLYFALMESSSKQATLGKMILGMKVTTMEGERMTFARASGRFFAGALSYIPFCLGYVLAAFTERKQALHDLVAQTLVIRKV